MIVTITKTALPVFALLTLLGPAAAPAHAQALPRPVIHKLIKFRTKQAYAVYAEIQKTQRFLGQVLTNAPLAAPGVQNVLTQEQAVLAGIQAQIGLLNQLLALEDAADFVNGLIQKARDNSLKAALQADLAAIQSSIFVVQSQIAP